MATRKIAILGIPVDCVDYQSALKAACELAKLPRASALSACNTHIISSARSKADFGDVMRQFDLILPDGMPLLWLLNLCGANLSDRVYGPYFMRYTLERTPAPMRHYFYGSTPECLEKLVVAARKLNPEIEIAGYCSPPFRDLSPTEQQQYIDDINAASPDFIWVALGGERQERWIAENLKTIKRGVLCAVGDAFPLLAGYRQFAPESMQKLGLTWFYRMLQEPKRLFPRYIKYNSLFVMQILADILAPGYNAVRDVKPHVSFVGLRGVPARYAGFETVVDQLGRRLAERGYPVTVYNRSPHYPDEQPDSYLGMRLVYLPTLMYKSLETIIHSWLCAIHLLLRRDGIVYLCGVGNALIAAPLRLTGRKVIINVDGIDYKRSKWQGIARWWLKWSEQWAISFCDFVIADNGAPVNHYKERYNYTPQHISYGTSEQPPAKKECDLEILQRWNLEPGNYLLFVSRLSPENKVDSLLQAYNRTKLDLPLVIVGPHGYEKKYFRHLQSLATSSVIFTGGAYGDSYRAFSRNCRLFILPAAIEATRLVLLDQMGYGNAVVYLDSPSTREVIADAGIPYDAENAIQNLTTTLTRVSNDMPFLEDRRAAALARARREFSWDNITDRYEQLFQQLWQTG